MYRSRLMMAAMAAAAVGTIAYAPQHVVVKDDNPDPPPEKVSRQRKRWLERQARKQQRKHRPTRR